MYMMMLYTVSEYSRHYGICIPEGDFVERSLDVLKHMYRCNFPFFLITISHPYVCLFWIRSYLRLGYTPSTSFKTGYGVKKSNF